MPGLISVGSFAKLQFAGTLTANWQRGATILAVFTGCLVLK